MLCVQLVSNGVHIVALSLISTSVLASPPSELSGFVIAMNNLVFMASSAFGHWQNCSGVLYTNRLINGPSIVGAPAKDLLGGS